MYAEEEFAVARLIVRLIVLNTGSFRQLCELLACKL
jgi:hypothetical protein